MKRTEEKRFSVSTEANTGETIPSEYCSVHPKKFCDVIKCDKCRHLYEYVPNQKWLCVSCLDQKRNNHDVLPFHSSGNCSACERTSVARILVERKKK